MNKERTQKVVLLFLVSGSVRRMGRNGKHTPTLMRVDMMQLFKVCALGKTKKAQICPN